MNANNLPRIEQDHMKITNFVMKDIFLEQFFLLINPV